MRTEAVTGSGVVVRHETTYSALPGGAIRVDEFVEIPETLDDLPRVGTVLEAADGLDRVAWFGAGPHETYPDRKLARIGRFGSDLAAQVVPYIWPQENGGHADVRWLELTGADGKGLRITLDQPRQVSVLPYRSTDLAAADHQEDLRPRDGGGHPSRCGTSRRGHGQLRPGHPAGLPVARRDLSLVLDPGAHRRIADGASPDRPDQSRGGVTDR